jgi:hypothetical protein
MKRDRNRAHSKTGGHIRAVLGQNINENILEALKVVS